ncbi:MAG: glycosyltransferase [Ferruginibacter sp.]
MNIVFLIPSLYGGGQEKAGRMLCRYLSAHHQVTAVCFEDPGGLAESYGCPVVYLPIPTSKNFISKSAAAFSRVRQLRKLKRNLKAEMSIAFGNTAIILNVLSSIKEIKIAAVRQSFNRIRKIKTSTMVLHMRLYVWALRRSEKIMVVSEAIKKELETWYHIYNGQVIQNGVDVERIKNLGVEPVPPMKAERQWIIHSGRFDTSKGHWHLLKIFTLIKKQLPGTGLILLGGVDNSTSTARQIEIFCKQLLEQKNLSWSDNFDNNADVVFAGHQQNPFKFISKSTVFVFPSLWEGFPNALIEAMACGIPVVAADCATGPGEILADAVEEYGILLPAFTQDFNPRDTEIQPLEIHWAQTITDLLQNKEKLIYLSRQSERRSQHFTTIQMFAGWQNMIEE